MKRAPFALAAFEQELKWVALALALASTIAIVQNWQPWPMVLGLPFCLIWVYCGWLRLAAHGTATEVDQHHLQRPLCLWPVPLGADLKRL